MQYLTNCRSPSLENGVTRNINWILTKIHILTMNLMNRDTVHLLFLKHYILMLGANWHRVFFTSQRNCGGVIFLLQFVFLSVCLSVCVCVCVCEQYSSRKDGSIWMRFSLIGFLLHWLGPYWNKWPWVKGLGHWDQKCI